MDPNTGKIYDVTDDAEREKLERELGKLIPIPEADVAAIKAMHLKDRIAWAQHRLARQPGETEEDYRKAKNAMKRQRRERTGK